MPHPRVTDRLVVALDGYSLVRAQEMVELLRPSVQNFEVGLELFTACGPAVIEMIRAADAQVFLDLKYHDIPSTVAKAVAYAASMGVSLLNIHASGGERMLEEARNAVQKAAPRKPPKLIAVTVLTSLETLGDIGVQFEVREQVLRLARLAQKAGLDGVNVSSLEIPMIRQTCGQDFLIVTPGIRLRGAELNDQRRVGSPRQAIEAGANYLVVGRPITEARDPLAVVGAIVREMTAALLA